MAQVKAVPQGMHTLTAQITLEGAAEAIEFYKRAFGAEEVSRALDPSGTKIWHAQLRIGDSAIYLSDVLPEMGGPQTVSLWVYVENADALFQRATRAGAQIAMPMQDMFWGDRMGKVTDRWGNSWTIGQHIKDLTPDEMKKAQDAFVASMKK